MLTFSDELLVYVSWSELTNESRTSPTNADILCHQLRRFRMLAWYLVVSIYYKNYGIFSNYPSPTIGIKITFFRGMITEYGILMLTFEMKSCPFSEKIVSISFVNNKTNVIWLHQFRSQCWIFLCVLCAKYLLL